MRALALKPNDPLKVWEEQEWTLPLKAQLGLEYQKAPLHPTLSQETQGPLASTERWGLTEPAWDTGGGQ